MFAVTLSLLLIILYLCKSLSRFFISIKIKLFSQGLDLSLRSFFESFLYGVHQEDSQYVDEGYLMPYLDHFH